MADLDRAAGKGWDMGMGWGEAMDREKEKE